MLVATTVLALVDLWQVALRAPGSLGWTAVGALVGLYLVATGTGAAVLRGVLRRSPATTRALLLAAGGFLFGLETVLRTAGPLSPWRPWLVAGAAALAIGGFVPLRRVCRRPVSRGLAALAMLLAAVGVVGAVRGFGHTERPASAGRDGAADPGEYPNVLVVVIDTLRADHLGCYGYGRPTSPVLDRLARDGALFERAFAQSSWTKPSTASLFTGRLPTQHQALDERSKLPDTEVTIPEALAAQGYATAVLSGNPWVTPEYGFDQGVDDFRSVYDERFVRVTLCMTVLKRVSRLVDPKMHLYNRVKYLVLGELSNTARDTRLVDDAVAWLAAHRTRPFFLYLHMMSPHHPYDPPAPFDRFVPDPTRTPVKNYPRKSYDLLSHGEPLPRPDIDDMIARYDGDVLYADTEVGRLLAALDRLGLAGRTLVLVTADHGEEFYDHSNWGHGQSVYNELVHVPLILRQPGRIDAGVRIATPVAHLDVLPTLLEVAGAPPPPTPGRSLLGRLRGAGEGGLLPVVSELIYRYGTARAAVAGPWKLVEIREGDVERRMLFDLGRDFAERRDLGGDRPEARALAAAMTRVVAEAARTRSAVVETPGVEGRERLRALGYEN